MAVIVDAESYESLVEAAEEARDRAALRAARAENDYIPWDDVNRLTRSTRDLSRLGPPRRVRLAKGTPSLSEILGQMRDEDNR